MDDRYFEFTYESPTKKTKSPRSVFNQDSQNSMTPEDKANMIIKELEALKPKPEVEQINTKQRKSITALLANAKTGDEVLDYLINGFNQLNVNLKKQWEVQNTTSFEELSSLRQKFTKSQSKIKTHDSLKFKPSYKPISEQVKQTILEDNLIESNERKEVYNNVLAVLKDEIKIIIKINDKGCTAPNNDKLLGIKHRLMRSRSKTVKKGSLCNNYLRSKLMSVLELDEEQEFEKTMQELRKNKKKSFNSLFDNLEISNKSQFSKSMGEVLNNVHKTTVNYDLDEGTFCRVLDKVSVSRKQSAGNTFSIQNILANPQMVISDAVSSSIGITTSPQLVSININNISHISNKSYNINNGRKKSVMAKKNNFVEDKEEINKEKQAKQNESNTIKLSDKYFDSFISNNKNENNIIIDSVQEGNKDSFVFNTEFIKRSSISNLNKYKGLKAVNNDSKAAQTTVAETVHNTCNLSSDEKEDTFRKRDLSEDEDSIDLDSDYINYPLITEYRLKQYKPNFEELDLFYLSMDRNIPKLPIKMCQLEDDQYDLDLCIVSLIFLI
jgi:hypothetical protein